MPPKIVKKLNFLKITEGVIVVSRTLVRKGSGIINKINALH